MVCSVMVYRVIADTELANTGPSLPQGDSFPTSSAYIPMHWSICNLFYTCFCLKVHYLVYIMSLHKTSAFSLRHILIDSISSLCSAPFLNRKKKKKRQPQMHKNEKDSTVLWFRLILKGHHLIWSHLETQAADDLKGSQGPRTRPSLTGTIALSQTPVKPSDDGNKYRRGGCSLHRPRSKGKWEMGEWSSGNNQLSPEMPYLLILHWWG